MLGNLIKNPTLSDLVGGICSVTLGDEEARNRGTQKSILERKAPPTFPIVIEMRERAMWVAHWVEDSVDALLTGKTPMVQVRRRDASSKNVLVEECLYDNGEERAESIPTNGDTRNEGSSALFGPQYGSRSTKSNIAPLSGPAAAAREQAVADGINTSVFDSMFGYNGKSSHFNASFPGSVGSDDPYAWAARLRDLPEEEALAELSAMGYTDGSSSRSNYSFASGTGSGKKKSSRRNSVGRAVSQHRRR